MDQKSIKPVFITNLPAPYRHHLFNLIAQNYKNAEFVFTQKKMDDDRPWAMQMEEAKYPYTFLDQSIWIPKMGEFTPGFIRYLFTIDLKNTVFFLGACPGLTRKMLIRLLLCSHGKYVCWDDGDFIEKYSLSQLKRRRFETQRAFAVFTPGKVGRDFHTSLGVPEEKIFNSYFSHDIEIFNAAFEKKAFYRQKIRGEYKIDENAFVILTISRFLDWKRLEDLAAALIEWDQECPQNTHFMLIGNGTDPKSDPVPGLTAALKNIRFTWVPSVPYKNITEYYAAADLVVHPSEGDIWGLVVNEALSMGVPVICTRKIGAGELVRDGVNGFKVDCRAPGELGKRIKQLFSDRALHQQMCVNSREIIHQWNSSLALQSIQNMFEGGDQ